MDGARTKILRLPGLECFLRFFEQVLGHAADRIDAVADPFGVIDTARALTIESIVHLFHVATVEGNGGPELFEEQCEPLAGGVLCIAR